MARVTLWTSAAAVRPERYDQGLEQGTHSGGTSSFTIPAGASIWFHFPIPSAWRILETPLYLERIGVLFETENCEVTEVAAYHGTEQKFSLSTSAQTGSFLTAGDENIYPVRDEEGQRPKTGYGVSASVLVKAAGRPGIITFGGAGATFHDDSTV
jgi:hypothetical protein